MAFPEMKVYCPPQPTRLVNNGTFTKNPKPTAPTFIPLPVPLYAKTAAKIHPNNPPFSSLKPSNCLLTVFTPLKPSNSTLGGKNSPNALGGNCMYTIKLQSSFLTFLIIIKGLSTSPGVHMHYRPSFLLFDCVAPATLCASLIQG